MAENYINEAKKLALKVRMLAKTSNMRSVFSIETTGVEDGTLFFPPIRYMPMSGIITGVVKVFNDEEADKIAAAIDGIVDTVVVDVEYKTQNARNIELVVRKAVRKSALFAAKLNDMTVEAADALLSQLIGAMRGRRIAVIGAGNNGSKLALKLVERGADVIITRKNFNSANKIAEALNILKNNAPGTVIAEKDNLLASNNVDVLVGFTPRTPVITVEMINVMNKNGLVLDGGIGTIFPEAISLANKKGIRILRLDMRTGFAGGMTTLFETVRLLKDCMGKSTIAGVTVVAGGVIGEKGDVIVNSISEPTQVIGVADGCGGVLKVESAEDKQRADRVKKCIMALK